MTQLRMPGATHPGNDASSFIPTNRTWTAPFTPAIRRHFRWLLAPELKGEQLDEIRDILQDDAPAPGAVPIEVNAKYPAGAPYPTTPSFILLALPPLPAALEYRIIEKDLILLDRRADIILDYIRNIIP